MKLIDILGLIPETDEFTVELYDDNDEMFYAYFIGPKSNGRQILAKELDCEVINIYAGTMYSVHYDRPMPTVSIGIRYNKLKKTEL